MTTGPCRRRSRSGGARRARGRPPRDEREAGRLEGGGEEAKASSLDLGREKTVTLPSASSATTILRPVKSPTTCAKTRTSTWSKVKASEVAAPGGGGAAGGGRRSCGGQGGGEERRAASG